MRYNFGGMKSMLKIRILAAILCAVFVLGSFAGCGKAPVIVAGYDLTNYTYSHYLDENGFFEGVKATDYVTLPEYKGVSVPESVIVADEETVQNKLDEIISQYDVYERLTDGVIKDGDTVNIDYVGSVDGVEFPGGSTNGGGTYVTIGVTNYIDDFLEQLIGHKPGENFDIEVTFPENYGQTNLNGKDAVFNITVNFIQGGIREERLNEIILANYGFANVEELTADIEKWAVNKQKTAFFNELIRKSELKGELPQSVLDYIICADLVFYKTYADKAEMDLELFLLGYENVPSVETLLASKSEYYKESALFCLAIQAIAELEGLSASEEAVLDSDIAPYLESYGMPYLKQYVIQTEVVPDFIINNAVIN